MLKQVSDHITEQTGEKVVAKPFVRILDLTSGEAFYHFMEPYTVRFEAGYTRLPQTRRVLAKSIVGNWRVVKP